MPTFTQEELDEFAKISTVENIDAVQRRVEDVAISANPTSNRRDSEDVEMKHEAEPNIQQVPAEESVTDDEMKDGTGDEFTEATERISPPSLLEQQQDQDESDVDVTMEDAAETQETTDNSAPNGSEAEPQAQQIKHEVSSDDSGSLPTSSDNEDENKVDEDVEEEGSSEESDASENGSGSGSDSASVSISAAESESESGSESESEEDDDEDDDEDEDEDGTETGAETTTKTCYICLKSEAEEATDNLVVCSSCGKHAHIECAQNDGILKMDEDSKSWQCQKCLQNESSESPKDASKRNRNSAPRLVRDLLPVSRGVQKPNSHSIFAQPLISEGEEGGRALRKRKSPTVEPPVSEKRRRRATPKALSSVPLPQSKADSMLHATRRASQKLMPTARILQYRPYEKAPPYKFILAFRLDQARIEKILNKVPRPGRRRDRRRPPKIAPPPIFHPPVPKFPALPTNHLIFPSMWGDRENEANAKPYGGILSDAEADTSRSLPQLKDRELFEIARKEAEEERRKTSAAAEAEINGESTNTTKPNRTVSGPPSKIKCIQFGKHVIDTFYAAPYPEEYSHEARLFICEFCLKYLPSEFVAYRHKLKCPAKHPPGDEIYRDGSISIWEVDGRKKTEYCQCLCLMAKMFLGSKTLYYDVEPFLFYILTEYDEFGYHFVGYFSKEKRPASQNNVSCILVMPIHQRKGYATFLIDFSYLLTRIEGKDGSPEKPLSDMGLTAYRSYWDLTIAKQLLALGMKPFSTRDLMQKTGMTADDVVHSLERLYAFVKDPVTKIYAIRYDKKLYETIVSDFESKNHRNLRPENLIWTPYIMGRSDQAHLDTQPVQTIAPREGDDIADMDPGHTLEKDGGKTANEEAQALARTGHDQSQPSPKQINVTDPRLVNGVGHVAPGPPSAQLLTGYSLLNEELHSHGDVNNESTKHQSAVEEALTGYALNFQNGNIPPSRFQIDPPIPASMLRARSHRKRSTGLGRTMTNGDAAQASATMVPVRSSPRHTTSINGSVSGTTDPESPEKPSTPVRRSSRKSGLSTMETVALDGSADLEDPETSNEIEAVLEKEPESASSSEQEEETEDEDEDEDDEDADEDDDEEEDAEVDDDDGDEEEEEGDDEDSDVLDMANGTGDEDDEESSDDDD